MKERLEGLTTRWLGHPSIFLESVDSTNSWLKKYGDGLPHGAICLTDGQTAGRGRLGRDWYSGKGDALAMSLLFKPREGTELLPIVCGIAVCNALKKLTNQSYKIKWPNDVLFGNLKICGILCESVSTAPSFAVAGIGVNLSQTAETFKREGLPFAGSLLMVSGGVFAPGKVAVQILNELEPLWLILKNSGFDALRERYRKKCITIGRDVRVISPNGDIFLSGKAIDIAPDGCLLVDSGGKTVPVNAGRVSVRGDDGYF